MNRRKPALPSTPTVRPEPIPLPALLDRALVGALVALVVARSLVAGDDPARLRLTSGGGPISFNLCVFLVFLGAIVWRIAYGRGRPDRWAVVVPLLLAELPWRHTSARGSMAATDTRGPGVFVAWEWGAIAAAVYLTRRLVPSVADSRGLLNVLVATAVSVAGLGLYQGLSNRLGLPTIDVVILSDVSVLAGDDEFYPELNHPPATARSPRGTFDSPATLVVFLFLLLPAAIAVSRGRDGSRYRRWVVAIPVVLVAGAVAAILRRPFEVRAENWSASMRLIAEHPLLGVGPGNFSRFAPEVLTPHSAWLGLAATTGLIGLGYSSSPRLQSRSGRRGRPVRRTRLSRRFAARGGSSISAEPRDCSSGSSGPRARCRRRRHRARCSSSGPRPSSARCSGSLRLPCSKPCGLAARPGSHHIARRWPGCRVRIRVGRAGTADDSLPHVGDARAGDQLPATGGSGNADGVVDSAGSGDRGDCDDGPGGRVPRHGRSAGMGDRIRSAPGPNGHSAFPEPASGV